MSTRLTSVGAALLLASACSQIPTETRDSGMPLFAKGNPTVTETYDITLGTPCNGLVLNGVTYSFTIGGVPSADCTVDGGPGFTNNISPPNLEGNAAGALTLTFDVPTTLFSFGVAQSTAVSPQPQSVIVDLYRPGIGTLRQELELTTTSDPFFVGGRFEYSGPAVKTAMVTFSGAFARFAFDNATYFRPPGQAK